VRVIRETVAGCHASRAGGKKNELCWGVAEHARGARPNLKASPSRFS
jgi:hypothetical protein